MTDVIVQTTRFVTLIGAGKVNKGLFSDALNLAPYLIAADGGAQMALNYGKIPEKVIGDMDSLNTGGLAGIPADRLFRIAEQETTDFEKCLRTVRAPLIIGVGFTGRRVDHQLAALSALVRHPDTACILLGSQDIIFHLPPALALHLPERTRVSLFPLLPVTGRSRGLHWPIDGLEFCPGGRLGTSNHVTDSDVCIQTDRPGLLAILPRACLATAAAALAGPRSVHGE